ncbi:MAG: TetR/AcrR family transcriptional regulator [Pseudomonadota bacterium]
MKTRERILQTALTLFNEEGEASVSTNHIADAMEISPGNLYYHFRNKDQIVAELFERLNAELSPLLDVPEDLVPELEDVWFFLHHVLERMNAYRFFYDNLTDITRRLRSVRRQFRFMLEGKQQAAEQLCRALRRTDVLRASGEEIERLSANLAIVMTYCRIYLTAASATAEGPTDGGAEQVMSLLAPYLREPERQHLAQLALAYR